MDMQCNGTAAGEVGFFDMRLTNVTLESSSTWECSGATFACKGHLLVLIADPGVWIAVFFLISLL